MPHVKPTLSQFNVGELNPWLKGRIDFGKYNYSSTILSNFIATIEGGFHRRGGTHFVDYGMTFVNGSSETISERVLLLPFKFSTSISYILEFGHNKIKFYKGRQKYQQGASDYEISSPYSLESLWNNEQKCWNIQYTQCGDVLYLFHEDYPIYTVSRYGDYDWRCEKLEIYNGPWDNPYTDDDGIKITPNKTKGYVTLNSTIDSTQTSLSIGKNAVKVYADIDEDGTTHPHSKQLAINVYVDNVLKASANHNFTATGWSSVSADTVPLIVKLINNSGNLPNLRASTVKSSIKFNFSDNSYAGKVIKVSLTFSGDNYYYVYRSDGMHFGTRKYWYEQTPLNGTYNYSLTVPSDVTINQIFSPSDVGRLIRLNAQTDNTNAWQAGKDYTAGAEVYSDGNWYVATSTGTSGGIKPVHTEGVRSDGGVFWRYKDSGYGIVKIEEYVSPSQVKGSILSTLHNTQATGYFEFGLLNNGYKNPKCGTFFKGRFWFLLETRGGVYACGSCASDFNNFADKTNGLITDENSVVVPVLSKEYNVPCWIEPGENLFIGTSGTEFYIGAAGTGTISPTNVAVTEVSHVGSKPMPAISINGQIFFVDRFGTAIRSLVYTLEKEGYLPYDTSVLSKHLFKDGISEWSYQEYPERIIWCITNNGQLVGVTLDTIQQVTAAHRHNLSGKVESVACIPSEYEKRDDLWVSVKRTVDNKENRFIEWMDNGYPLTYTDTIESMTDFEAKENSELEYFKNNSFYVDSGKIWERITGDLGTKVNVPHLKGQTVAIMANGAERDQQVVDTNGQITIRNTDTKVIVGLPIDSVWQSQNIFVPSNGDSGVGDIQQIDAVEIMFYRTGGGVIGPSLSELSPIYFRKTDEKMDKAAKLFTGNKKIPFGGRVNTEKEYGATVVLKTNSVYPMNVLSVSPKLTFNDI